MKTPTPAKMEENNSVDTEVLISIFRLGNSMPFHQKIRFSVSTSHSPPPPLLNEKNGEILLTFSSIVKLCFNVFKFLKKNKHCKWWFYLILHFPFDSSCLVLCVDETRWIFLVLHPFTLKRKSIQWSKKKKKKEKV